MDNDDDLKRRLRRGAELAEASEVREQKKRERKLGGKGRLRVKYKRAEVISCIFSTVFLAQVGCFGSAIRAYRALTVHPPK